MENINRISNLDVIDSIENASGIQRLPVYLPKESLAREIGLVISRASFYGMEDPTGKVSALDRDRTKFNIRNGVKIHVEGILVLLKEPENVSGPILYQGYGLLEVDGIVIYDGRAGSGVNTDPSNPSTRDGDMKKVIYDTNGNGIVDNAEKVSGFTVSVDVPSNALFTDTIETESSIKSKRPIKTVNNESLEGTGNIQIDGGVTSVNTKTGDVVLDGTEIELINGGGVTVTEAISDLSVTAANGLNDNGGTFELGGVLTKDTLIGGGDNGIKLNRTIDSFGAWTDEVQVDLQESAISITAAQFDTATGDPIQYASSLSVGKDRIAFGYNQISTGKASYSIYDSEAVDIKHTAINGNTTSIVVSDGVNISDEHGLGLSYTDRTVDEANVNWGPHNDHIPSIGLIKANTASQTALDLTNGQVLNNTVALGLKANKTEIKTVRIFPTQETSAFTVADNSDRFWYECDFASETEVTITANSVGVIGEIVYLSLKGDGQIKFVESGVTISFNAEQSLLLGSKGDKIALVKTGATTYEIV